MTRPTLEVADILHVQGDRFLERYRSSFDFQQLKAFRAIQRCRTAALGGHRDTCQSCGHQAISYNSCRNRHCPKCQAQARERWLAARERELLDTSYFHVVFTVPHELNPLALENPTLFYDLLFTASPQTLLEIAADPKHLGAEIGIISTLHTWGQNLLLHPHIHCVIPAGGLSLDHRRWLRPRYPFFLPVKVLSRVFRGKFLAGLKRLHRGKKLQCAGPAGALADQQQFAKLLRHLHRHDWVVYAKPAFGGPLQVLRYLGRYTHRVAISNHRLLAFDQERVTFRWKDYAHNGRQGSADADNDGVLAPLLSARAAQRLRPHPSLRVSRQSLSPLSPGAMPTTAGLQLFDTARSQSPRSPFRQFLPLALCPLRRIDDRHSEIYSRRTISMCVLRFFLAAPSVTTLGCAPARRRTRVSTLLPLALFQPSIPPVCRSTHDHQGAFSVPRCPPASQSDSTRTLKSHRPASAAPAASS